MACKFNNNLNVLPLNNKNACFKNENPRMYVIIFSSFF